MSDSQVHHTSLLNSIIGEGTSFKGEFDLNGLLRIDGDFFGTIRTQGQIIVGLNGRARCNIYAESVVVGGMVSGNIFATDKVVILSTGLMIGNISTPRLIIEEGVTYNGNCRISGTRVASGRSDMQKEQAGAARIVEYRQTRDTSREEVSSRN